VSLLLPYSANQRIAVAKRRRGLLEYWIELSDKWNGDLVLCALGWNTTHNLTVRNLPRVEISLSGSGGKGLHPAFTPVATTRMTACLTDTLT
jgi:hypothetical protein